MTGAPGTTDCRSGNSEGPQFDPKNPTGVLYHLIRELGLETTTYDAGSRIFPIVAARGSPVQLRRFWEKHRMVGAARAGLQWAVAVGSFSQHPVHFVLDVQQRNWVFTTFTNIFRQVYLGACQSRKDEQAPLKMMGSVVVAGKPRALPILSSLDIRRYDCGVLPREDFRDMPKHARLSWRGALLHRFPRKSHPQAGTKVNIFLDCVLFDLLQASPSLYAGALGVLDKLRAKQLLEDQVCAALLYAWACAAHADFLTMLEVAIGAIVCPSKSKAMSDIIKTFGWSLYRPLGLLVEMQTLQGRGVGEHDLYADAIKRLDRRCSLTVEVPDDKLRAAVQAVYREELGRDQIVHVPSSELHFVRRLEWCVGGSHNRKTNPESCFDAVVAVAPNGARCNRRMAMEALKEDPLPAWSGRVGVSVIPKLEHGKVRAIYSCGTLSYMAFSRVLRPVEQKWRGHRVILDPGEGGAAGMNRRVIGLWQSSGSTAAMLDYEDFNSQHTLRAQEIVFEELFPYLSGISTTEYEVLLRSFSDMHLVLKGRELGRVGCTLMSGHRATSFINSVLNAAYLRCALDEGKYNRIRSLHVGDDVLVFCRDENEGYSVIEAVQALGCKVQMSKQSVGRNLYEFLRVAGSRDFATGYLARAVASLCSGNWVTDYRIHGVDALRTHIQQARSIMNRSGNSNAWRLVVSSCCQQSGCEPKKVAHVVSGTVALYPGPCYRGDGRYVYYEAEEVEASEQRPQMKETAWDSLPYNATRDYFSAGMTAIEREACGMVGYLPWAAAVRSTYGDLAPNAPLEAGSASPTIRLSGLRQDLRSGVTDVFSLLGKERKHGVLANYPVVMMIKSALSTSSIAKLVAMTATPLHGVNPETVAFGPNNTGCTVFSWLPYSDAAVLGTNDSTTTWTSQVAIAV